MVDLEKLRSCGRFELYSTARGDLGFFKNVACAATYTKHSSAIPLQDLIYRALHIVIAQHSLLSAIVLNEDKEDSEVYFARLPSVDLRSCVTFVERRQVATVGERDEELAQVLQEQHNLGFKQDIGSKPFWRLIVLQNPTDQSTFTAVWFFHHALGDGGCGPIFHRTLLSALQAASPVLSSDPTNPIVASPSTSLLPPFEDLHPHPITWPFFIRAILGSIFPSYFAPRAPKLWTGPCITAPDPLPGTRVQLLTLSPSTTMQLLKLSRANKTTMQATIECCIATALFSVIPAETYDKVIALGNISLRSILQHESKSIEDGNFVLAYTDYTHMHTRASHPSSYSQFPWEEARAVRSTIQAEVAKNGADNNVSLLRYVSDMHKLFTEKIGQERNISFELSNLGMLKTETGKEGGWKLGRCVFSQSPNLTGAPIVCSVITGGDGCCMLVFSWLDGVVAEEMVRAVVQGVEKQVQGLVSETS